MEDNRNQETEIRPRNRRNNPKNLDSRAKTGKANPGQFSLLSQFTFAWFWTLARLGWRRSLTSDDLISLPENNSSVLRRWEKYWKRSFESTYARLPKLVIVSYFCFRNFFLPAVFMNLATLFFQFLTPQILSYLLNFIQDFRRPLWEGLLIAGSLALSETFEGLFQQQYMYKMHLFSLRLKGVLMPCIFKKSLRLYAGSVRSSGDIISHATSDVQRVTGILTRIQMLWASPLQVILALVFLWQLLGYAALVGLLVTVIFIPINIYISKFEEKYQVSLMKRKDDRIKMINEILNGIKVIKMYAWEPKFEEKIGKFRNKELKVLRTAAILSSCATFSMTCAPLLVAVVSFIVFTVSDPSHILTPEIVFVSLALFNLLRQPLNDFPAFVSGLIQANVSRKRIETFLLSDELDENAVSKEQNHKELAAAIFNGSFKWSPQSETAALENINFSVERGKLVAVVGQVGSGKSALLSALLGELYKSAGNVHINGSIAFVPQQAWIRNATVRQNITFTNSFDPYFYETVVNACALKPDIALLPAGDETEIGEKGVNLSGGQKQRISLARAVYQDKDIYLLDDPLSAVDVHVGRHIFENVLSSNTGLLKNKTRILVTHSIHYLQRMDLIVVIRNGSIDFTGTYDELKKEDRLSNLVDTLAHEDKDDEAAENESTEDTLLLPVKEKKEEKEDEKKPIVIDNGKIMKKEDIKSGRVNWGVYFYYFKVVGYLFSFLVLMLFFISCAFGLVSNIWLAKWTTEVTLSKTQAYANSSDVNFNLFVYFIFGFCEGVFIFIASFASAYAMIRASRVLHRYILHRVFRSPMSFFDVTSMGTILNRFSADFDMVDFLLPLCVQYLITSLLRMFAMLLIVIYATPFFAIIVVPFAIFYFFIQKFFVNTASQLKRLTFASQSPVLAFFAECSHGRNSIRAYEVELWFLTECHRRIDNFQTTSYPNIVATRWLALYLQFLANLAIFSVAVIAVCIRDHATLDVGLLGLSVTYSLMITWYLILAVRSCAEVATNIVSVERIKEYTELPSEADWVSDTFVPESWPNTGNVKFVDYSTRYRPELGLVLKNLNVEIPHLNYVGVVGRTGAGKSSMALSLLRMIEAANGYIAVDGEDTRKLGLHDLRSKLAVIPQDPVLFSDTLRLNLDPFMGYEDKDLWEALEKAHLKPFVESLPQKLENEIYEGGGNLSVGQRQLICLARALLKKSKILILDEATAPVDIETERLILATIKSTSENCSVIMIAHRINTVMDCNKIMVMSEGNVIEFDSPANLLADETSVFYSMAKEAKVI